MVRYDERLIRRLLARYWQKRAYYPPSSRGTTTVVNSVTEAFAQALGLVATADPKLVDIVLPEPEVSLRPWCSAALIGLPLGAAIAVNEFRGQRTLIVMLNALMGLPSVVVGLVVYLLLSRAGPLGALGHSLHADGDGDRADDPDHADDRRAVAPDGRRRVAGVSRAAALARRNAAASAAPTLLWDLRFSLVTIVLAGFGRAASEVGAVMIVGGNIDGVTRVMTTTIALETSKGDLPLALGLGFILLSIVLALNAGAYVVKETAQRRYG